MTLFQNNFGRSEREANYFNPEQNSTENSELLLKLHNRVTISV